MNPERKMNREGPEAGKASGLSAAMRAFQFFRIGAFHGGFGPV
jgi:hypothetical protein